MHMLVIRLCSLSFNFSSEKDFHSSLVHFNNLFFYILPYFDQLLSYTRFNILTMLIIRFCTFIYVMRIRFVHESRIPWINLSADNFWQFRSTFFTRLRWKIGPTPDVHYMPRYVTHEAAPAPSGQIFKILDTFHMFYWVRNWMDTL